MPLVVAAAGDLTRRLGIGMVGAFPGHAALVSLAAASFGAACGALVRPRSDRKS